jgi:hypothetical protein
MKKVESSSWQKNQKIKIKENQGKFEKKFYNEQPATV